MSRPAVPLDDLRFPWPGTAASGYQGEVAPGIHWLRLPLPFKPEDHINVWLLQDDDGYAVIDTGLADATTRALWEAALAQVPGPANVLRVYVSHHHPDHIGLTRWFADHFGAAIHLPARERELACHLFDPASDGELAGFYRAHGMPIDRDDFVGMRHRFFRTHVQALPERFVALEDGDAFPWGDATWQVRLAGGHTPAHLLLHCPAKGVLITGDHILPEIVTNIGALSFDPQTRAVANYLASLETCADLPADTLVLPAHGLPFTGLRARCTQLGGIHRVRLNGVLRACARGESVWNMLPSIYGRELTGLGALLGFNQTKAYLDYLADQGRVAAHPDDDGIVRYRQIEAA